MRDSRISNVLRAAKLIELVTLFPFAWKGRVTFPCVKAESNDGDKIECARRSRLVCRIRIAAIVPKQ
jgi:hypothetical protein